MEEALLLEAVAPQILSAIQDTKSGWISGILRSQSVPLSSWNVPRLLVIS